MDIFEDDRSDYNMAGEAITLIKRTDAVERCYTLANYYADKAIAELDAIPDSEYKQALVDFAKFIVSRDR